MAKGILLEAGTNEMELLVFRLAETAFGINVAKVREIIPREKTVPVPHAPPAVEGSFRLRERVLTLVNLGRHFRMEGEQSRGGGGMIIVVEFNNLTCGLLVDVVEVIHRLSWDRIDAPSPYLTKLEAPVTGTVQVDGETVLVADFETIIGQILGVEGAMDVSPQADAPRQKTEATIVVADDSALLRKSITRILNDHGYENLLVCSDGREAWDLIQSRRNEPGGPCDLVLSDIEMPRMDGLHLTSRIKQDPELGSIPVVLFSSLINDDNRRKCRAVGADAQVSKPESAEMIAAVERLLEARRDGSPGSEDLSSPA